MACAARCRYQKEGKCSLQRVDVLRPIDGAECMQDMWEMEEEQHNG